MNEFRKHLETYVKLTDEEFENVIKYFILKKYKKKEYLVRAGTHVSHTYWVVKGLLVSSFIDKSGKEHILQFAIENCWVTDQNAFYNQSTSIFNIIFLENSELLCLSFENREKLCSEMQKIEHFFRKKGNDSFVKQQKRLLTYLTSDAKERFELLLQEYPGLFQRLSKKTIAAYLGVTRETLSRFKD
jgi:CRP-like cAMP-binding protein